MSRTGLERLNAIEPAVAAGNAFLARVKDAEGDLLRCADLMAEAIGLSRDVRRLETIGRDGRSAISMEELQCMYCVDGAREAYLRARTGSNRFEEPAPLPNTNTPPEHGVNR